MKLISLILILISSFVYAQEIAPLNGVQKSKPNLIAIKNATIVVSGEKTIQKGTIIIQDDKIVNIGSLVNIPNDALVLDYEGKTIFPVFIETNSSIGLPKVEGRHSFFPQMESNKKGAYYWNESIHPEVNAIDLYSFDDRAIEEYIKMGFGIVSTRQNDGITQGTSAIYSLGYSNFNKNLIKSTGIPYFSFQKGVSNQTYPSSQMGSIALLRQALYDAMWYNNKMNKERNLSLEALNVQIKNTIIFHTTDKYEILRAQKIANEFALNYTYIGSGKEYEILEDLKAIKSTLILPLTFPLAYDVKDPYISKEITLGELKYWETAASNPYLLIENGNKIAITSSGLNPSSFWKNVKIAIEKGLKVSDAIDALTITPATILGIEKDFGSLEEGKKASFMIYDSNPFENEAQLLESWILGEQKIHQISQTVDVRGKFNMVLDEEYLTLIISGSKEKPSAKIKKVTKTPVEKSGKKSKKGIEEKVKSDTIDIACYLDVIGNDLVLQFNDEKLKWKGNVSLHGKFNAKFGILEGDASLADGKWMRWSAIRNETAEKDEKKEDKKDSEKENISIWFPNLAYGFEQKPSQEAIVIKNVTIWTNEKEGIIENGTVVVENGKIIAVGNANISTPKNARIVDGKGKHLTSGIIDEHSHIAISKGVNEGGQAVSAEVSIGDVVRADDIDIYRQLSGGVTASQLLHGSANPIGGQSALIKLKWGHTAAEMLIPNAPKFIKFALGENVKQANWGEFNSVRFPQTRMGVEQIMFDAFKRAQAYEKEKIANPNTYRKDLELEAVLEILKSDRHITCHSYVQSEINMLMHLADSFNFKVNTFTHILEGYKLADKMKAHGAGGSTFADWWAYKYEVNDAIPQNAAMMTKLGVLTAINSDDAEMGRRLNQEAGKTVKYGGATEEEAWKMVTLNPAKLLHLDDRMGSIKIGKDADIVLWSANPLSIEAIVEMTVIDGEVLYEKTRDADLRKKVATEKARIITKMLDTNKKGGDTQPFNKKKAKHFHCNTFGEEGSEGMNEH